MKIHHFTLPASDPAHVAAVLAELTGGRAVPLPHGQDSFLVADPQDPGTALEIWPRTTRSDVDGTLKYDGDDGPDRWPHHGYVSIELEADAILAVFEREGWPATLETFGPFPLVRGWIEGKTCIELVSPSQRDTYVNFFRGMLSQ